MKPILLSLSLLLAFTFARAEDRDTLVYNSRRALKLEGGSNFRDLGGYPAAAGKTVKWGHIYRSADISKLTEADLSTLVDRRIATVCDLRGPDEVKNSPDRLPAGAKWVNLPAGSENIRLSQMGQLMNSPARRDSLMTSSYSNTAHFKAKYQPMFDELLALDGGKALLFHCTAGKDRTGIGAALVLSALGVPQAMVLKDYAATNEYWTGREQMMKTLIGQGMDSTRVRGMMAADPLYLEKTFAAIDQQYGSMDNFLVKEMELTPEKLAALRAKYLQ
ncbi:MAG: tyrosine-protein phosphatase [Sphingobacteriaceae bacterium]|nr:tyrosine-protein phosphatase [Cytophagaceae bacterium]